MSTAERSKAELVAARQREVERVGRWRAANAERVAETRRRWRQARTILRERHRAEYDALVASMTPDPLDPEPCPTCGHLTRPPRVGLTRQGIYNNALTALAANHPDEFETIRAGL